MPTAAKVIPAKRRYVDFLAQPDDHECALLAAMGFSTHYIMAETGLSACQVTYRIRKAGLTQDNGTSRLDFRNGKSPFASAILRLTHTAVDRDLVRYLKKKGG